MSPHLRIARPVSDLQRAADMYRRGLGLRVVGAFEDHEGFDGVMLGLAGSGYHFEFTRHRTHPVAPAPTAEDLAVFYMPAEAEWQAACARMQAAGFTQVASFNPYWDARGRTYEDPDGYRVVVQRAEWSNLERPDWKETGAMRRAVEFHDESRCREIESLLVDRIYEFNVKATGYADGRLVAGTIQDDTGEIIAGINGHTWGGCCVIDHVWVHDRHRGQGLGKALMHATESEAVHRGCEQVVLITHTFQAPEFYEHLGYERKYAIEGRPKGHADIVYVKRLSEKNGT